MPFLFHSHLISSHLYHILWRLLNNFLAVQPAFDHSPPSTDPPLCKNISPKQCNINIKIWLKSFDLFQSLQNKFRIPFSQGTFIGNFVSNLASSVINIWCEWLFEWAFGNRYRHRTRENTSNSPRLLQNEIYSRWCFKTTLMLTLSWKRSYSQNSKIMARCSPVDSNFKIHSFNLVQIKLLQAHSSQVCQHIVLLLQQNLSWILFSHIFNIHELSPLSFLF